ncbi:MAG: hypothetical protein ACFE9Z_11115 [Promethearchaeota archaeon]
MKKKSKLFIIIASILILSVFVSGTIPLFSSTIKYSPEINPKLSAISDIKSPIEGKTYTPLMSGYYPATYGFETDDNYGSPEGWYLSEMTGCTAQVIKSVGDHSKVLELHDSHPTNYVLVYQSISNDGYGSIEFWMRNSDVTYQNSLQLYTSTNYALIFGIMQDKFKYWDGSWNEFGSPADNTWYHITIDYESTEETYLELSQYHWRLWIDEVECGVFSFGSNGEPDKIEFGTQYGNAASFYAYIDAVGYSWDSDYYIGDNNPHGYYPATYGFEDNEENTDPNEWTAIEEGGQINVKDLINGHKKVVEIYDTSSSSEPEVYNVFTPQTSGTIEYWVCSDDVSKATMFNLLDDQATSFYGGSVGTVALDEDKIRYHDATYWHDTTKTVYDNTWYHIKIEFECGTGYYKELAPKTWRFYIDGEPFGDFEFFNDINNVAQVWFYTYWGDSNYHIYLDAVGYSWDPNYEIGDNRYEGLLLDIENDDLSDMEYTITSNGNPKGPFSILGDTVIPVPEDGDHTITLLSDDIEIDSVYFTTESISPPFGGEEFHEPMEGYYPATYGFENDEENTDPDEWTTIEEGGQINVKDLINGHKKVVEIYDTSSSSEPEVYNVFTPQTSGTIEYWVCSDDVSKATMFNLLDDQATSFYGGSVGTVALDEDKIRYHDATYWHDTTKTVYDNTWYHIKIEFECGTGYYKELAPKTWRFYIDGEPFGDFEFFNDINNVAQVWFYTYWGDWNYHIYLDAVGYSWDSNYNNGDNRYEGILLVDDYTEFDWIGYSYDNGPITTLDGDKVFSLFGEDYHSIQLIRNDATGSYCCSKRIDYTFPPFGPLIGSTDRIFPQEETPSRLGYTISTIYARDNPVISFGITDTIINHVDDVNIKIFVNNEEVSSITIDISSETTPFKVITNKLLPLTTHQIIIELSDGVNYKISYLKILNIYCIESDLYENDVFTPFNSYFYEEEYDDEVMVSVGFATPFDDETLSINSHFPTFRTEIGIWINSDNDYPDLFEYRGYYIDAIQFQWKILCPNGYYLESSSLGDQSYIGISYNGDEYFPEVSWMQKNLEGKIAVLGLYIPWADWIIFPLDVALTLLDFSGNPTPPRTDQGPIGNYEYFTRWWAGRYDEIDIMYTYPIPGLYEATFLTKWTPNLPIGAHGHYQIILNWKVEPKLYRHQYIPFSPEIYDVLDGYISSIEGVQYINFEYID